MEFVRIEYTGSKVYRDRTAQKTVWNPGDTRPVPAQYAKVLLRFAEFSLCAAKAAAKTTPSWSRPRPHNWPWSRLKTTRPSKWSPCC